MRTCTMAVPRWMSVCLALAAAGLFATCSSAPMTGRSSTGSSPDAGSSTSAAPKLAARLITGPPGWTSQAPSPAVTLEGCTDGVAPPRPLSTVVGSWRQDPGPPSRGMAAVPSVDVCLDAFSTSTGARDVLGRIAAKLATVVSPSNASPSSLPSHGAVPGVPGAVASFLDMSTVGQLSIWFTTGNDVSYVMTRCSPAGGSACAAGPTAARRHYAAIQGWAAPNHRPWCPRSTSRGRDRAGGIDSEHLSGCVTGTACGQLLSVELRQDRIRIQRVDSL
jgi:hypothetical protein